MYLFNSMQDTRFYAQSIDRALLICSECTVILDQVVVVDGFPSVYIFKSMSVFFNYQKMYEFPKWKQLVEVEMKKMFLSFYIIFLLWLYDTLQTSCDFF